LIAGTAISAPVQIAADDAKGHCMGANARKGRARARPPRTNARDKISEGKGFTETTKEECDKVEGATFEPAKS
jgi:hypothetical protein